MTSVELLRAFMRNSLLHSLVQCTILHHAVQSQGPTRPITARRTSATLGRQRPMSRLSILAAALIATTTIAGCEKPAPSTSEARPVRTVTVERGADGEATSLTGHIRAKDQVGLAFRLDGRMIERPVNVGDVVKAGQVVARLDPQNQQNS